MKKLSLLKILREAVETIEVDVDTPIEEIIKLSKEGFLIKNKKQNYDGNIFEFAILEDPRKLFKWRETPLRKVRKDLVQSLLEKGFTEPIVFATTLGAGGGQIFDGNHRLIAAIKLKIKRVPVFIKSIPGRKPMMPFQYSKDLTNQQDYKMQELEKQGSEKIPEIPDQWWTTV